MNFFLMLQGVVALVVVNVLVSRFAHRRNALHREQLENDEMAVRQLDYKILEAQRREQLGRQRIDDLNGSIDAAEKQLKAAEKELEAARNAPPDLHFIFDRLEPKPGIIWEVMIARNTDVPMGQRMSAVWKQPRRYLITAKTPKEAHDRASQRFFEKTGLTIASVSACELFVSKRPDMGANVGDATGGARTLERARAT